ncbi:MAG: PAS-domain containing protein, partial [Roseomonas mucosa]|nr:PAS-domain containing protein [Roseomonas mucosa]
MPDGLETIGVIGQILDSQGLALCLFDAEDRTLLWNRTFLRFFPEHDGHVHVGEPYASNLERFYAARLSGPEHDRLPEFVAAGIARHRTQTRPFSFEHRGRRLLVSSLPLPQGGRVRVWKALAEALPASESRMPVDPFAHLADGATVLDREGRITDANQEFVELYDLPSKEVAIGRTFREVLQLLWEGQADAALDAFLDNARFAGAPFEVELP